MTGLSLNTGLKALLAARTVLDTIGHNVANANTPGYSRQSVSLSNALALPRGKQFIGTGVDTGDIRREVDQLVNRRILTQRGVHGALGVRAQNLSQFESFLSSAGGGSFGGLLDEFFSAASGLATSPSDGILRTSFVQAARSTVDRLGEINAQGDVALREVRAQMEARAAEVNAYASEIAALNTDIEASARHGTTPNDLLDRRDRLIDQLSELVDVTTVAQGDGAVNVLVSGNMLVSASRSIRMSVVTDTAGDPRIQLATAQGYVPVQGGALGGLLSLASEEFPRLRGDFDEFTHQLVLATNRIHSTGMPATGPMTFLAGTNRLQDVDQDGKVTDELLSNAGLPFDVTGGGLWINVEELATGTVTKSYIEISSTHTTVQDLLDELNALGNVSAAVDGDDQFRIVAQNGFGFDFTTRVEPRPDAIGSFGGGRASLNGGSVEPFSLADGDTLILTADPGGTPVPFTVTFDAGDFEEISQATAEEIAAVIRSNANAQASGITAEAVAGELVLQTLTTGTGADLRVDGGTALGGLGLAAFAGVTVTGQTQTVDPVLSGAYTGDSDRSLTFRPTMDGAVGVTQGLGVEVYDQNGDLVSVLDVGAGYVPGTELTVADGVTVSFGLGDLSATHGDLFQADLVADSDTSDVLVALGLNSFFTGSSAGDLAVRQDLLEDPNLVATSVTGASGDGQVLLELLQIKDTPQAELGGASLDQRYGDVVGGLGLAVSSTEGAMEASDAVLLNLELRRDQISGVDVDEELVDMVAFEQAYSAAARYINVVSQLSEELLALL